MRLGEYLGFYEKEERNVEKYLSARISSWISDREADESFAVFGGNVQQRNRVTEQGIARCFGRIGVIVIHNNEFLEQDLMHILEIYPELLSGYGKTPVCYINQNNLNYMPLLGMEPDRAAEVIYPELSRESPMYLQQHLYADGLKRYLRILQYRDLPLTLGSLLYLCRLDLEALETRELSQIPEAYASEILSGLMQDNVTRQIRADVESFAGQLYGRIWGGQGGGGASILTAARNRALISIRVPSHNASVLNYLSAELSQVLELGIPCLLVIDSVQLGNSLLRGIITAPGGSVPKILSGSSVQELCGETPNSGSALLYQFGKIILFQCANAAVAAQYSDMIGNYLRRFMTMTENKSRGAFDLFSGHGRGESFSMQEYARIKPEELMRLGNGAVLIDQVSGRIQMTKNLV